MTTLSNAMAVASAMSFVAGDSYGWGDISRHMHMSRKEYHGGPSKATKQARKRQRLARKITRKHKK